MREGLPLVSLAAIIHYVDRGHGYIKCYERSGPVALQYIMFYTQQGNEGVFEVQFGDAYGDADFIESKRDWLSENVYYCFEKKKRPSWTRSIKKWLR